MTAVAPGGRSEVAAKLPPGDYVATVEAHTGAQQRPFALPAAGATLALP